MALTKARGQADKIFKRGMQVCLGLFNLNKVAETLTLFASPAFWVGEGGKRWPFPYKVVLPSISPAHPRETLASPLHPCCLLAVSARLWAPLRLYLFDPTHVCLPSHQGPPTMHCSERTLQSARVNYCSLVLCHFFHSAVLTFCFVLGLGLLLVWFWFPFIYFV